MAKGKHDKRKEQRKEERSNSKKSKTPRSLRSNGYSSSVSKIEMNEQVEELLIKLMTMLDAGDTDGDVVAAMLEQASTEVVDDVSSDEDEDEDEDGEEDQNHSSCTDEDDDEGDDDDDDDIIVNDRSGSRAQVDKQRKIVQAVLTDKQRHALVRKLIRDDRRKRIDLASKSYDEKCARKVVINRNMTTSDGTKSTTSTTKTSSVDQVDTGIGLPVQYRQLPTGYGPQVRITVSCESKKSSCSKLIVVERTENLESLVNIVRKKFNVPQKYSELTMMPTGMVLDADRLFSLSDGTHLVLVVGTKGEKHGHDTVLDGDARTEKDSVVEESSVKEMDESTATIEKEAAGDPIDRMNQTKTALFTSLDSEILLSPAPSTEPIEIEQTVRTVGNDTECAALLRQQQNLFGSASYSSILTQRASLPIFKVRDHLLSTIRENPIVVVSGETGSGKTTQLPAYIFEDLIDSGRGAEAYIICTQPRRIAAITVAERVSFERQESVGNTVGYQVRLNSRCCASTRIVYCTTGVLLRRLQQDNFLDHVSHIVVDEVHERQVETDFLMTLLKQRAPQHPHLRLIMMSATMQESMFADYFKCPIIYVQGRTFAVEQHYLPDIQKLVSIGQRETAVERGKMVRDGGTFMRKGKTTKEQSSTASDLDPPVRPPRFDAEIVAETVIRIIQTYGKRDRFVSANSSLEPISDGGTTTAEGGDAILVFLSGIQSIDKVNRALRQRNLVSLNAFVYTLHGSLPPEQQRRVFKKSAPGSWKIVLSTNIAETSVTLDDVTHVVDCGLVKELRYDPKGNMSSLEEVVISRASARQRAGRAGRVRPGHCWRLYTKEFHDSSVVDDHPTPEIRRVPLEEVVLQVLLLQLGLPEQFLSLCLEPPSTNQIKASVACLLDIKAILPRATLPLTALGYHLARMPVDVRIGKMLLTASLLGCLEPALTVAAALAGKSPFFDPPNNREEAYHAHSSFTSSHNYHLTATQYGVEIPDVSITGVGAEKESCDDLTPQNHVFFSDHLATSNAYELWALVKRNKGSEAAHLLCRDKFLSHKSLEDMQKLRDNFRNHLSDVGFCDRITANSVKGGINAEFSKGQLKKPESNIGGASDEVFDELEEQIDDEEVYDERQNNSNNKSSSSSSSLPLVTLHPPRSSTYYAAMRCALCAGLYPQIVRVARYDPPSSHGSRNAGPPQLRILQSDGVDVSIHPSSLTHKFVKYLLEGGQGLGQSQGSRLKSKDAYIVYHKKVATGKVYLHDCTAVPAAAVLLFGGDLVISRPRKGGKSGDHSRPTQIRDIDMVEVHVGGWIIFKMSELHAVLYRRLREEIDALMQMKVENPHCDVGKKQKVLWKILDAILS